MRRRRRRLGKLLAALGVILLACCVVLVASPLHRTFYLGLASDAGVPELVGSVRTMPLFTNIEGGETPPPIPLHPIPPWLARVTLDSEGRLSIPVADHVPWRLPAEGVPRGWDLREFAGKASVELVSSEIGLALRLRSAQTSFALYRDVVVNVAELPLLAWWWRVARLPADGDVRRAATDDQAVQLYLVFPRWPSPQTASDVIGYVWDTTAPVGTTITSPKAPNVKVVVVESGPERLGAWQRYQRNVRDDYIALFGKQPPRIGSVAIMTDSNDTGSAAEALVGEIVFARASP